MTTRKDRWRLYSFLGTIGMAKRLRYMLHEEAFSEETKRRAKQILADLEKLRSCINEDLRGK